MCRMSWNLGASNSWNLPGLSRPVMGLLLLLCLVETLRYMSEGRVFNCRWCHWKFSLTYSWSRIMDLGVDSASNKMCSRNISREVKATFSPSCADCFEIWEPQPSGNLWDFNPFRSYIGPRPRLWFSSSDPLSEDVRHGFCCVYSPAVGACPTFFLM
jgi:hypothetical protein